MMLFVQVLLLFFLAKTAAAGTIPQYCAVTLLEPIDRALSGNNFGDSLAAWGQTLVVASWSGDFNEGKAWVFHEGTLNAGDWTELMVLKASDYADVGDDRFGSAVGIHETTIIFGAYYGGTSLYGCAYVFVETTLYQGDWHETMILEPAVSTRYSFGYRLTMKAGSVFFGSRYDEEGFNVDDESGAVHQFTEDSPGVWTEKAKIFAHDAAAGDQFGDYAVVREQTLVVRSSGNTQKIYILHENTPQSWIFNQFLDHPDHANFGSHFDLVGTTMVVSTGEGHGGVGTVIIYRESSLHAYDWTAIQELTPTLQQGLNCGGLNRIHANEKIIVMNCLYGEISYMFAELDPENELYVQVAEYTPGVPDDNISWGSDIVLVGDNLIIGSSWLQTDGAGWRGGVVYVWTVDEPEVCITFCESSPCQNGGSCVIGDSVYCDCEGTGAVGTMCEISCNGGTALATPFWESCNCEGATGYGTTCSKTCLNGGSVSEDLTGCDCSEANAFGNECQNSCYNGYANFETGKCECDGSGATGKWCDSDIDDCESAPCENGGVCSDLGSLSFPARAHEFNCSCGVDSPFMGPICTDTLCYSSPCLHGGTCVNGEDFACDCTTAVGYEGDWCQTEIDECASSPCLNDGICFDLLGDFTCNCAGTGYEGLICSEDVDDCLSSPCQNDGVCKDKGANKFKCTCDSFWEGDTCSDDVDDCLLTVNECLNGGACEDDPVNMGDVICTCIVEDGGFTGKYCHVPIEDACVTFNPCRNGGKCIVDDITKEMSCDCTDTGYEGDVCDVQVYFSECVSSPCLNGGQCYDPSDLQNDYYCACDDTNGYFGDLCELTACDSMPCQNGGTCVAVLGGDYICTCPENYAGPQCQVFEDDEVQQGIPSSTSSNPSNDSPAADNNKDDDNTGTGEDESTTLIIVGVVIVLVIAAILMYVYFIHRRRDDRNKFVMPT